LLGVETPRSRDGEHATMIGTMSIDENHSSA